MKKIYAGNLSFSTTEERLTALFSEYGEVASATIIKDKFTEQSKGFGFVEMPDDVSAASAISSINGKEVDGRKIRVSEAVEKPVRSERGDRGERPFRGEFKRERRGGFNREPRSRDNEY